MNNLIKSNSKLIIIIFIFGILLISNTMLVLAGEPLKRDVKFYLKNPVSEIKLKSLDSTIPYEHVYNSGSSGNQWIIFTDVQVGDSTWSQSELEQGAEYKLILTPEKDSNDNFKRYKYEHTFKISYPYTDDSNAKPFPDNSMGESIPNYNTDKFEIQNYGLYSNSVLMKSKYFTITGEGVEGMEIIIEKLN